MSYFIEPHIIDEIRERTDIVDVIGQYVDLKQAGNSYKGLCPFHTEKTPSFSVSPEKKIFKCFGCGEGGSAINFLMKIENYSFPEAAKTLADMYGIEIATTNTFKNNRNEILKDIYKLNRLVAFYYLDNFYKSNKAINYMKNRGYNPDDLRKYGIGYSNNSWNDVVNFLENQNIDLELAEKAGIIRKNQNDRYYDFFRDRIMFPIIDHRSRVLGFGGRIINTIDNPKYLNTSDTPIYHKKSNLFNINRLNHRKKVESVFLVEGYMDVLGLENNGLNNVVATLGTAITKEQANLLKRYTDLVYIVYDGDEAGQNATSKALEIFNRISLSAKAVIIPDGLDPEDYINEFGVHRFKNLIKKSEDSYSFLINRYKKDLDMNTINGKYELIKYISSLIKKISSPIERDLYIQKISNDYGISKRSLYDEIKIESEIKPKNINIVEKNQESNRSFDKTEVELIRSLLSNKNIAIYTLKHLDSKVISNTDLLEVYRTVEQIIKHGQTFNQQELLKYFEENYILEDRVISYIKSNPLNLQNHDSYKFIDELISKLEVRVVQDEKTKIIDRIQFLEKNPEEKKSDNEIKFLLDKLMSFEKQAR